MLCLYIRTGEHVASQKALASVPGDCIVCDIDLISDKPEWLDGVPLLVESRVDTREVVFYRGTRCIERLVSLAASRESPENGTDAPEAPSHLLTSDASDSTVVPVKPIDCVEHSKPEQDENDEVIDVHIDECEIIEPKVVQPPRVIRIMNGFLRQVIVQ